MTGEPKPLTWPYPREVLPFVTVELTPPPCERSFVLIMHANGDLAGVGIDGTWYAATKRKKGPGIPPGGRHLSLVEVRVRLPEG